VCGTPALAAGAAFTVALLRLLGSEVRETVDALGEALLEAEGATGLPTRGEVDALRARLTRAQPSAQGAATYAETAAAEGGMAEEKEEEEEEEEGESESKEGAGGGAPRLVTVKEVVEGAAGARPPRAAPAPPVPPWATRAPRTRVQRTRSLFFAYPSLASHLLACCAAFAALVKCLAALRDGAEGAQLLRARDAAEEVAALLLDFAADAWHSELRPALESLCDGGAEVAAAAVGGDEAPPALRAALAAPLAAAAAGGACALLGEDGDVRGRELLATLPLLLRLPTAAAIPRPLPQRAPAAPPPLLPLADAAELFFSALGPPGPLRHPIAPLLPALALRAADGPFLSALAAAGALAPTLAWLRAVCRAVAMEGMAHEAAHAGGGGRGAAAPPPRARGGSGTAISTLLSLGCAGAAVALALLRGARAPPLPASAAAGAARDLVATARRGMGAGLAAAVGGAATGALVAFSRHAAALAAALSGAAAAGDGDGRDALREAAFECFQGLESLQRLGEPREGGAARADDQPTQPPPPFFELWVSADDLFAIVMEHVHVDSDEDA
jgi:hypothetical protein